MTKEQELKTQFKEKSLARKALSKELNNIKAELIKYYTECLDKAVADGVVVKASSGYGWQYYKSDNVTFYVSYSGIQANTRSGVIGYCCLKNFINHAKKLEDTTYFAEATKILKYLK